MAKKEAKFQKVKIVKPTKQDGESVYPGSVLKLSEQDAAVLVALKKADPVGAEVEEVKVSLEDFKKSQAAPGKKEAAK